MQRLSYQAPTSAGMAHSAEAVVGVDTKLSLGRSVNLNSDHVRDGTVAPIRFVSAAGVHLVSAGLPADSRESGDVGDVVAVNTVALLNKLGPRASAQMIELSFGKLRSGPCSSAVRTPLMARR
jgi:hypothetical protein